VRRPFDYSARTDITSRRGVEAPHGRPRFAVNLQYIIIYNNILCGCWSLPHIIVYG